MRILLYGHKSCLGALAGPLLPIAGHDPVGLGLLASSDVKKSDPWIREIPVASIFLLAIVSNVVLAIAMPRLDWPSIRETSRIAGIATSVAAWRESETRLGMNVGETSRIA